MFLIAKRGGVPLKIFFSRLRRVVYLGVLFFQTFKDLYIHKDFHSLETKVLHGRHASLQVYVLPHFLSNSGAP